MNASTLYGHDDGGDAVEGDGDEGSAHGMEEEDSPGEEDPKKVNIWSSRGQKRPGIYSIYRAALRVYWFIIFSLVLNPLCLIFYC